MVMKDLELQYLMIIVETCRRNWVFTGRCSANKSEVEDALRRKLEENGVTAQNEINLKEVLEGLSEKKLIKIEGENIICNIPFTDLIENILSKESIRKHEAIVKIQEFFNGSPEDLLEFLQHTDLIKVEKDTVRSNITPIKEFILDEVLTFIEKGDALQIQYGLYDASMTGTDVLSGLSLPKDPFYVKAEYGLRELMKEKFLLPLTHGDNVPRWEFRSRIAEIVRLLYKLRQRFESHHSYRASPKLTRSVKLEVVDRKFPKRNIPISKCMKDIEHQMKLRGVWKEYVSAWEEISSILLESMKKREFEMLSNFQDRCFKKIFLHLTDPQSKIKGLVVSAGTGMGKTLSYFGPLLLYILFEKTEKRNIGTKAICIYPRIKLAENQIEGFIKLIYEINQRLERYKPKITIGIDYSGTPYRRETFRNLPKNGELFERIRRKWKYDQNEDAYICPYAVCPICGSHLYIKRNSDFTKRVPLECSNPNCNVSIDFVMYCKEDIASEAPDILIITTESLSRRLYNAKFQNIFGSENFCAPKLIMIDEIHLHTSLRGSQIALLIRRLLQRIKLGSEVSPRPQGEPIVLGLSATIGHAEEFFHELTGIPEHLIEVEGPTEEELEKSGVEYFIFIKPEMGENIAVLSNLIQTCMCVLHNMPQPSDFPKRNHKALGFVDSLDLVRRWWHDLYDAEKRRKLYQLRDPDRIMSDIHVRNYFGHSNVNCEECATAVNRNCVHFREGECWWFMKFGKSQRNPLRVSYKTADSGYVPKEYDLVVTTSAMEVGYDDPDLMCIFQYLSPMNIASFTQRKGRAGRSIRNRPISVAILSPYRTKDIYYYRNHHILISPSFEKLPLNVENKTIKKIHGFYAILDLLAFERRNNDSDFPERVNRNNIYDLEEVTRNRVRFEKYLRRLFGYKVNDEDLEEIFSLVNELIGRLNSLNLDRTIEPHKILDDHLPENLFSSINLPEVDVYEYNVYDGDEEWRKDWECSLNPKRPEDFMKILESESRYCPKRHFLCAERRSCSPKLLEGNMDINLALSEASISNVTFRWGNIAFWIPPYDMARDQPSLLKQMNIQNNWLIRSRHQNTNLFDIRSKLIPETLKNMVPRISSGTQDSLPVIRPDVIRVAKFLTPSMDYSHWIYCFDCDKIFAGAKQYNNFHQNLNHHYATITERTTSYPFAFYDVEFRRDLLRKGRFKRTDYLTSNFETGKIFGIYGDLFTELYFANNETGEPLNVRKVILGATCSIITQGGRVESVFGYTDGSRDVGLGYNMYTDGIDIWVQSRLLDPTEIMRDYPEIFSTLKNNFFKFEVLKENKKPGGYNSYSVDAFLNVYLTFTETTTLPELLRYCQDRCADSNLQRKFQRTIDSFFTLNSRTKREIMKLFKTSDFMELVVEKHRKILNEEDKQIIFKYIEDTFLHSLKHALKSTFVVLGGFESERDIGGWTYLNFDYPNLPKHIYIFEYGMHGTGAFLSIYNKFRENPQTLWNLIEEHATRCSTAEEEIFLREVLRLDDTELQKIAELINRFVLTAKFAERKRIIQELMSLFRKEYLMELTPEELRALMRVFSTPLELGGTKIENWRLFKELNITLYDYLKRRFGRDLSTEEIQEYCFRILMKGFQELLLPTWKTFFNILKERIGSEYELFIGRVRRDLNRVRGLKRFLGSVTLEELEKIHHLSIEEQIEQIRATLGSNRNSKRIAEILFTEIDDVPSFKYYYFIYHHNSLPNDVEDLLRYSLTKRLLREEIEKRLLNTCVDACPSCLQTRCDIDFNLRSKLLLSRRLLRYVILKLKEKYTINAGNFKDPVKLKEEIIRNLQENYQVYLKYTLNKSKEIAKILGELLAITINKNGVKYRIIINSSGYRKISLKEREVIYELNLRCKEESL